MPHHPPMKYAIRLWLETQDVDQFLVTALVRHPIERSMLGYVVLERQITQSFVDRIGQQADAEWLVTSILPRYTSPPEGYGKEVINFKSRFNFGRRRLPLAKQSA